MWMTTALDRVRAGGWAWRPGLPAECREALQLDGPPWTGTELMVESKQADDCVEWQVKWETRQLVHWLRGSAIWFTAKTVSSSSMYLAPILGRVAPACKSIGYSILSLKKHKCEMTWFAWSRIMFFIVPDLWSRLSLCCKWHHLSLERPLSSVEHFPSACLPDSFEELSEVASIFCSPLLG